MREVCDLFRALFCNWSIRSASNVLCKNVIMLCSNVNRDKEIIRDIHKEIQYGMLFTKITLYWNSNTKEIIEDS